MAHSSAERSMDRPKVIYSNSRRTKKEASSACAIKMSAAVQLEVETASQASEPASQASEEEEEVPVTDIYFPPDERSWVYSPLHYTAPVHSVSDEESDT